MSIPCKHGRIHTANRIALPDFLTLLDTDLDDDARHGGADGARVVGCPLASHGLDCRVLVLNRHGTNLKDTLSIPGLSYTQDKLHLSINLEPNIARGTALNNGTNRHETDDKGLTLLDGDVHLFADIWAAEEVPSGDDTVCSSVLVFTILTQSNYS